jgi:hypothetical protein
VASTDLLGDGAEIRGRRHDCQFGTSAAAQKQYGHRDEQQEPECDEPAACVAGAILPVRWISLRHDRFS